MKEKLEAEKKKREIDDKISIFGILSATKNLTNPLNGIWQVEQERLQAEREQIEVSKRIEKLLEINAKANETLTMAIVRIALAIESRNKMLA